MSSAAKIELVQKLGVRYLIANRKEKGEILDMITHATGNHRKYAIRLLGHGLPRRTRRKRRWPIEYQWLRHISDQRVVNALVQIWRTCECMCVRRLHRFLPETVSFLERHKELVLDPPKALLLDNSPSIGNRVTGVVHTHAEAEALPNRGPY